MLNLLRINYKDLIVTVICGKVSDLQKAAILGLLNRYNLFIYRRKDLVLPGLVSANEHEWKQAIRYAEIEDQKRCF